MRTKMCLRTDRYDTCKVPGIQYYRVQNNKSRKRITHHTTILLFTSDPHRVDSRRRRRSQFVVVAE
jgi:hypothetical protein